MSKLRALGKVRLKLRKLTYRNLAIAHASKVFAGFRDKHENGVTIASPNILSGVLCKYCNKPGSREVQQE